MEEQWIGRRQAIALGMAGVAAFHIAYEVPHCSWLMLVFVFCCAGLGWVKSSRIAFWSGLAMGLAIYAPQLTFFFEIFHFMAVGLWLLLAIWVALFVLLVRLCAGNLGRVPAILLMPFLWTGLEYFRSELYYLRFSWLTPGMAFSDASLLLQVGAYGIGFLLMAVAAMIWLMPLIARIAVGAIAMLVLAGLSLGLLNYSYSGGFVTVVGIQTEKLSEREILAKLDEAIDQYPIEKYPRTELVILSEYAFGGPIPEAALEWCKKRRCFLIAGGIDYVDRQAGTFRDTVFVVSPEGRVVFSQAKSVPIQFFNDGLPAKEQRVWDSPFHAKMGLCICYDLSYSRVTDELVRQGANVLIVPTMDASHWGEHEHRLHSRIGPIRAAEYGIPVVRVASSGISQLIDCLGTPQASLGLGGEGEMIHGFVHLGWKSKLPPDRWFAPICVALVPGVVLGLAIARFRRRGGRMDRETASTKVIG